MTKSTKKLASTDPLKPIPGIELFFGLVGPTGTDLQAVCEELSDQLKKVGYESEIISLSDMISEYCRESAPKEEYERIKFLMRKGNKLREMSKQGDFVARLGVIGIRRKRQEKSGDAKHPVNKKAYILRSFKRKEEVDLFRTIYGKAFNLVSVYSSVNERLNALSHKLANSSKKSLKSVEHQALELINIDMEEDGIALGQNVRDTFPLADYFVTVKDSTKLKSQFERLIQLIFGNPYLTPTREEQAMFFAQAAALRSGDLSRQVGSVIVASDGDILATGCNEVPKKGGGFYWSDDSAPIKRDIEIGHDMNAQIKREIVEELFDKFRIAKWVNKKIADKSDKDLYDQAIINKDGFLRESSLLDVIEFGRAVHAEMAAITNAAKRGISIKGAQLFCTTFPCHLCARHIISSGIERVVYIEPYPKSRTEELFSDSVIVNPTEDSNEKVSFSPFIGVAPRRYFDFFQPSVKRKDQYGNKLGWEEIEKDPKAKQFVLSNILIEEAVVEALPDQDQFKI